MINGSSYREGCVFQGRLRSRCLGFTGFSKRQRSIQPTHLSSEVRGPPQVPNLRATREAGPGRSLLLRGGGPGMNARQKSASQPVGFPGGLAGNADAGLAHCPTDAAPAGAQARPFASIPCRLVAPARSAPSLIGAACGGGAAAAAGWVLEEGPRPGLPCWARRAPKLASRQRPYPGLTRSPSQTGWARGRPAGAMEDEVVRIAKKMDKMVQKKNAAGALDLLKELKNIPMTLELLQSTRIGMSVNAIRKQSTDEEVTSLAKSLIKSWKKLLDGPSTDKDPEEKKKDTAITSQNSPEAREESSSSGNVSSRKDETNARDTYVSSFPRAPNTSDSVRLKCREMLAAALRTGDDYIAIGADEEELGSQIEEAIYQEIRNTDMKYKNRVRSRISNLKDAKNPNLRKNVLCGNISPDLFARMTAEEMASDELKEMRKNLTKEAIREHQMAKTGGTQTDLFTCGKCKKKNCTYTQVQTRSADEPMTTFVVCNECGNRWKFC